MFARKHKKCRGSQRGQAYVEFIIVLPLFLIVIAGVIGFGRLMYAKLATQAAAWSACRHAAATLNEERGIEQATLATRYTLAGFSVDPNAARLSISHYGWGRGRQVAVQICYNVPPAPIPMGDAIAPQQICSYQAMLIEPWQSQW